MKTKIFAFPGYSGFPGFALSFILIVGIFFTTNAQNSEIFYGDWETGVVTGSGNHNWKAKVAPESGIVILNDGGARQGSRYARVTVSSGRSEVTNMQNANSEYLYEDENTGIVQYTYSVKFPTAWRTDRGWALLLQLHSPDSFGTTPTWALLASQAGIFSNKYSLALRGGDIDFNSGHDYDLSNSTLNIGHWTDFIITVKYARDNTGFISIQRRDEGQINFTEVLNLQNVATVAWSSTRPNTAWWDHQYMRMGLYRSDENFTDVLYNDGFTRKVVSDTSAPSTPTGLAPSKIGQTSFTLNWSASIDDFGVAGYEVFKDGTSIGTTTTTSMSVTGLNLGTTYSMKVRARDAVPYWSEQSTALNVTTSTTPDIQAPGAPTGLMSGNIGPTSFFLSWTASTDNMDVTGYEVFKDGISIGTTTATSISVTGLSEGTAYIMKVRARDAIPNWSEQSTALNVTTLAAGGSISSNAEWQSFALTTQTSKFTAEFDAVPYSASMDGVTGIQNGTATAYTSLACVVQFATNGRVLARNAVTYTADKTVNYIVGTSYHFRMVINIPAHTYSIYVTPSGQSEITLGSDYTFRSDQASVTQLNGWSLRGVDPGTHTVSNMTFTPIVTSIGTGMVEKNTFFIYPNPANSNLSIRTDFAQVKNAEFKIYDVLGKEVFRKEIFASEENINISNLWNGIYFLTLQANGELAVQKFIIQH